MKGLDRAVKYINYSIVILIFLFVCVCSLFHGNHEVQQIAVDVFCGYLVSVAVFVFVKAIVFVKRTKPKK